MKRKFFKKISVALVVMIMAMALVACKKDTAETPEAMTETMEAMMKTTEATGEIPETDREGYAIEVPEKINSIVSLAPSISEILIGLGLDKQIVGIDTNTQNMGILSADLPAFDLQNPDAEQVLALKPDVVFVSGMSYFAGENSLDVLKNNGICVISIPTSESIEAIKKDIRFMAAVVGKTNEGEAIVTEMEDKIAKIAAIGETITEKKTVYLEISPAPYLYSFGQGVFLNEMIEIIGAENIFSGQKGWMSVNAEDVVAANPDVILSNVSYDGDPVPEILARDGFSGIEAIKNKEVYSIDYNPSSIPSQNIVKALQEMAKAVYPDYY